MRKFIIDGRTLKDVILERSWLSPIVYKIILGVRSTGKHLIKEISIFHINITHRNQLNIIKL